MRVKNNLHDEYISRVDWGFVYSKRSAASADKTRGHKGIDLGLTGNNNSIRKEEHQGIPMPNVFKHTREPGFSALFVAMSESIAEIWSDQVGSVYNDEARRVMFAGTFGFSNFCETIRAAMQTVKSFGKKTTPDNLHQHTDKNNDHKDAAYSPVFGFNWLKWDAVQMVAERLIILAYGKMSAFEFIARLVFYKKNLDAVVLFYNSLPKSQK